MDPSSGQTLSGKEKVLVSEIFGAICLIENRPPDVTRLDQRNGLRDSC